VSMPPSSIVLTYSRRAILPLLAQLELQERDKIENSAASAARHQLNQFIRQVWQAHLDAFEF